MTKIASITINPFLDNVLNQLTDEAVRERAATFYAAYPTLLAEDAEGQKSVIQFGRRESYWAGDIDHNADSTSKWGSCFTCYSVKKDSPFPVAQKYEVNHILRSDQTPEEILEIIQQTLADEKAQCDQPAIYMVGRFYSGTEAGPESYVRGMHSVSNAFPEYFNLDDQRQLAGLAPVMNLSSLLDLPQFAGATSKFDNKLVKYLPEAVKWIRAAASPASLSQRIAVASAYPVLMQLAMPESFDKNPPLIPDLTEFSAAVDRNGNAGELLEILSPNNYLQPDQAEAFCKSGFAWTYLQSKLTSSQKQNLLGTLLLRLGAVAAEDIPTNSDDLQQFAKAGPRRLFDGPRRGTASPEIS